MKDDGPKPTRQAPKNPRKYNRKASNTEPTTEPMEISSSSALETSEFSCLVVVVSFAFS